MFIYQQNCSNHQFFIVIIMSVKSFGDCGGPHCGSNVNDVLIESPLECQSNHFDELTGTYGISR